MLLKFIKNIKLVKRFYSSRLGKAWVQRKLSTVIPHLSQNDSILDIGCGNGLVTDNLRQQNFQVTPMDVGDLSILESVKPIVYDGEHIPFEDQEFSAALLLTVLHHTDDPIAVLKETKRVAKRIVIIEDIYSNVVQKYMTYAMDTLVNLGHSNMTYQNKSDKEWKVCFEELGLNLIHENSKSVLLFFRQATYVVEVATT
ncbi:MAG: methyltransferase domain-containing protein [Aureispira sp.]|nr:methyltransferase domain-containing protein [Aureispira sp.]